MCVCVHVKVFGFPDPPLHDPCAVAYVIAPHLFKTKDCRVNIESRSEFCDGQTVCDLLGVRGEAPNATVALTMDVAAFWDLMIGAVAAADRVSVLNDRR